MPATRADSVEPSGDNKDVVGTTGQPTEKREKFYINAKSCTVRETHNQ